MSPSGDAAPLGAVSYDAESLSAACGRSVHFHPTTESTNRLAMSLGQSGAPAGTLVVADAQSGGRGRLGRQWASPAGQNIYMSLVLRPALPPDRAALCCLAAATALAEVLDLSIKWPNDVLDASGGKVAGILAELHAPRGVVEALVLGVGINVNQVDFAPELPNASSLARVRGVAQDRTQILARVVPQIERRCAELEHDPERVLSAWRDRSQTLGATVRIGEVSGEAIDIRTDGALLVRASDGLVPILTGDVEMVARSE